MNNKTGVFFIYLNYCGKIFKATYWPFLISKASAKVACEGKLHNHIINSHYGNL